MRTTAFISILTGLIVMATTGCTQKSTVGSLFGSGSSNGASSNPGSPGQMHAVNLAWNASTSPNVNYYIYRGSKKGGPYTKLNSTALPSLNFTDANTQSGAIYYYVATSVNSNNAESAPSNEVSVSVP